MTTDTGRRSVRLLATARLASAGGSQAAQIAVAYTGARRNLRGFPTKSMYAVCISAHGHAALVTEAVQSVRIVATSRDIQTIQQVDGEGVEGHLQSFDCVLRAIEQMVDGDPMNPRRERCLAREMSTAA